MTAREHYTVRITCSVCGKHGMAGWSEWERASTYSGNGRRIESVPDGFELGEGQDRDGDPVILCSDCNASAS